MQKLHFFRLLFDNVNSKSIKNKDKFYISSFKTTYIYLVNRDQIIIKLLRDDNTLSHYLACPMLIEKLCELKEGSDKRQLMRSMLSRS